MDEYIPKPVKLDDLCAALEALIPCTDLSYGSEPVGKTSCL
jgi:hypothetical protein